jgi:hypothetical protein
MGRLAAIRSVRVADANRLSAAAGDRRLPGELKIIAAALGQSAIEKILTHLGLQAYLPSHAPARGQALQAT